MQLKMIPGVRSNVCNAPLYWRTINVTGGTWICMLCNEPGWMHEHDASGCIYHKLALSDKWTPIVHILDNVWSETAAFISMVRTKCCTAPINGTNDGIKCYLCGAIIGNDWTIILVEDDWCYMLRIMRQ